MSAKINLNIIQTDSYDRVTWDTSNTPLSPDHLNKSEDFLDKLYGPDNTLLTPIIQGLTETVEAVNTLNGFGEQSEYSITSVKTTADANKTALDIINSTDATKEGSLAKLKSDANSYTQQEVKNIDDKVKVINETTVPTLEGDIKTADNKAVAAQEKANANETAIGVINGKINNVQEVITTLTTTVGNNKTTAENAVKQVSEDLKEEVARAEEAEKNNLAEAKSYADNKASTATTNANNYTDGQISSVNKSIEDHEADKENPHKVTATQLGLEHVENKSTTTIKLEFTGAISENNTGFVTGGSVYSNLNSLRTDLQKYSDDNLDSAKGHSNSNLASAKNYTDEEITKTKNYIDDELSAIEETLKGITGVDLSNVITTGDDVVLICGGHDRLK